ncbi:MAG: right-handed parallel beta-helix repeat-containing protein, partial [Acutalibacteraceae bacterium]|nr:right-handed parallel beta-helix repeat-containing protein [Acutalibacteraceae bacterium]
KRMCRDFNRDDLDFDNVEKLDETTVRVTLKNKDADFVPGHIFQTRNIVRDQTGGLFNRCKNLHFDNLRIKFMHGLGMVSQFCENVSYINCDFTPAEGRTIASTADFFQFSGCRGNLTVDSCKAYGAQDDYVNVHGTHLRIVQADKEKKTIVVRFMHPESWGFQAFEEGDELEFIKWDTLIPYAETKVVSYKKLNDTDILLALDRELPQIEIEKDVVENVTWTPNLYVRNCDFGPTCGRGVLCTTRGEVIIENNRFRNLWGPALLLEDDCNFWFESGYTKSVTFRNNLVENCEYAEMWQGAPVIRCTPKVMKEDSKEFVHSKLVVENNCFKGARESKHLFWLEYIKNIEVKNNVFDAPYDFYEKCVGNVADENNVVL